MSDYVCGECGHRDYWFEKLSAWVARKVHAFRHRHDPPSPIAQLWGPLDTSTMKMEARLFAAVLKRYKMPEAGTTIDIPKMPLLTRKSLTK